MALCWSCGEGTVILDRDSGARVCDSCGLVHSSDVFEHQAFDSTGRAYGSLVHSVGTGVFGHRERTAYRARALIADLSARLGLSAARAAEASELASDVTSGAFGSGDWFSALAAACAHLVARRHRLPLGLPEVAATAGLDSREVARMAGRVVRHLEMDPLPEFDAVRSLERTIKSSPVFRGLDEAKSRELIAQGRFLMQCAIKWFLTTGRQPLPLVAAVAAFVAEANKVEIGVEEIAKEIYANATTSKLRLKELAETLVQVARSLLPWGADVNVKNIVQHAPLLMKFMEMKAKSNAELRDSEEKERFEFNLEEILDVHANQDEEDYKYFRLGHGDEASGESNYEVGRVRLSGERLSLAYERVLERLAQIKDNAELGKDQRRKRSRGGFDFEAWKDSWLGNRSDCGNKLTLEQVVKRDVGFDMLPPSYIAGLESRRSRRVKIEAAKHRINQIMKPSSAGVSDGKQLDFVSEQIIGRKRRRRENKDMGLDWEDCIIELLLLHQVNEDEIEQGQYTRLLDLHVFKSFSAKG